MKFFKNRLDRFEKLIIKGNHKGAIERMKNCVGDGVAMGSDVAKLVDTIRSFDAALQDAINKLEASPGNAVEVLTKIRALKRKLTEIEYFSKRISRESKELIKT